MRTLAIGDIHGCNGALRALLEAVQPGPEDQVIFLGDYIDRGPASRGVVDSLLDLENTGSTIFLRGNHEAMILDAREDALKANLWQSYGGLETLYSYKANYRPDWAATIPAGHWKFFERTVRFFENDTHIFVHACLDRDLDMSEQPDWLLYWEFFDRLQAHKSGKRIVCGHTPQSSGEINDSGFGACIDTGPAFGGWLTCLDVNSGKYWQAKEDGTTRAGILRPRAA
jgi:serine/threonine protein phosphatase 1